MSSIRRFEERLLPGSAGATIAAAFWPGEGEPLVCVHGLTSSSRAFAGLATELPHRTIIAVDCLGRGKSSKQGPFGLARHADDLGAVMAAAGLDRATVIGHSMGAYVAGAFCAAYPDRVSSLVFIDGGFALEIPAGSDPEQLLAVMLGPFLEKLRREWSSLDDYIAYYESLPLYAEGVDDYGREHLAYDLAGEPPRLRARMTPECLAADWCDILDTAAVSRRLEAITVPLLLLRAPGGLTGTGDVVVPDQVRDAIIARVAGTSVVDVPGANHHTILVSRPGAQAVSAAIEAFTRSRLRAT